MLRRGLITAALAGMLFGSAYAAVYVGTAPPPVVVERRPIRPGPRYVWMPGYHRWNGRAYAWAPGRWVVPPRLHAVWVPPRWVHGRRGWVMVQGYWR